MTSGSVNILPVAFDRVVTAAARAVALAEAEEALLEGRKLSYYCTCLVGMKKGANITMKVKRLLLRQRHMFGPRIKIM